MGLVLRQLVVSDHRAGERLVTVDPHLHLKLLLLVLGRLLKIQKHTYKIKMLKNNFYLYHPIALLVEESCQDRHDNPSQRMENPE